MDTLQEILKFSLSGEIHLIGCPKGAQEEMQSLAYEMLGPGLNPSGRNAGDLVRLTISDLSNAGPDEFPDIARLGTAIYRAAGFRDQFEGLVLVDARRLAKKNNIDVPRLQALGEAFEVWAGRAHVYVFGDPEQEVLIPMANALDVSGRLSVHIPAAAREKAPLEDVLDQLGIQTSESSRQKLSSHISSVQDLPGFSLMRCLSSIARGTKHITMQMVQNEKNDPFSYSNRLAYKPEKKQGRRIGFDTNARERSDDDCISNAI